MSNEKTIISIVKNQGTPMQEVIDIQTDGYILFYLKGDKVKTSGDIELKALAPVFMKLALEKFTNE